MCLLVYLLDISVLKIDSTIFSFHAMCITLCIISWEQMSRMGCEFSKNTFSFYYWSYLLYRQSLCLNRFPAVQNCIWLPRSWANSIPKSSICRLERPVDLNLIPPHIWKLKNIHYSSSWGSFLCSGNRKAYGTQIFIQAKHPDT